MRIRGLEMLVFRKMLRMYVMDNPKIQTTIAKRDIGKFLVESKN